MRADKFHNLHEVRRMKLKRDLFIGLTLLTVITVLALSQKVLEPRIVAEAAGVQAPMFEVDPLWPKPLPNHWILGNTIGIAVDSADNVWMIHRTSGAPNNLYKGGETC